jgi:hypothetical protein
MRYSFYKNSISVALTRFQEATPGSRSLGVSGDQALKLLSDAGYSSIAGIVFNSRSCHLITSEDWMQDHCGTSPRADRPREDQSPRDGVGTDRRAGEFSCRRSLFRVTPKMRLWHGVETRWHRLSQSGPCAFGTMRFTPELNVNASSSHPPPTNAGSASRSSRI